MNKNRSGLYTNETATNRHKKINASRKKGALQREANTTKGTFKPKVENKLTILCQSSRVTNEF